MPPSSYKRRTGACVECNKRKIRCEFADGCEDGRCCDACQASGTDCVPRSRKKRKIATPNSPVHLYSSERILESRLQAKSDHTLPCQYWNPTADQWESTGPPLAVGAEEPPHLHSNPSGGLGKQNCTETATYIGRSQYLSHDLPIDENSARAYRGPEDKSLSGTELKTLELWGCSVLPPKPVHQSLIDTFMQRCYPWTPVLSIEDVKPEKPGKQLSLLLNQALFLAASRVSSAPGVTAFASQEQFYQRAKVLFWLSHEKNPLTVIAASILLHWYNPDGPEHVSFDTSRFWLQIGVGLAHQVGLHKEPTSGVDGIRRRRLWWSLVARDSLISSGQGRPRVINLKDSDIRPPCLEDFPDSRAQGELFLSYVKICILLGDLTECRSRKHMPRSKKLSIENALYRWIKTLPNPLRLSHTPNNSTAFKASSSNFNSRQLHLPYLITITIMARSMTSYPPRQDVSSINTSSAISSVAILSSSLVAGIFEEFLARDELQFLGPIFTFYLLAAGMALASTRRYPNIWCLAQQDLEVLKNSLQELAKRWPTAIGALRALQNVIDRVAASGMSVNTNDTASGTDNSGGSLLPLSAEQKLLVEDFPSDLCRLWSCFWDSGKLQLQEQQLNHASNPKSNLEELDHVHEHAQSSITEHMTAEILGNLRYPAPIIPQDEQPLPSFSLPILDSFGNSGVVGGDNGDGGGIDAMTDCQYAGIGDWLLTDWGGEMNLVTC